MEENINEVIATTSETNENLDQSKQFGFTDLVLAVGAATLITNAVIAGVKKVGGGLLKKAKATAKAVKDANSKKTIEVEPESVEK